MEKNLHRLLLNIEKLPAPPPTMNPVKFEKAELYIQFLLNKLEIKSKKDIEAEIFLKIVIF